MRVYCGHKDIEYPIYDVNKMGESFSPSINYPEYRYSDISKDNKIYDEIRNGFLKLGYDADNYGTDKWNPLGKIIKKGDNVLVKPNWVMHNNPEKKYHDMSCLVTNPSIIRAILDYVVIALEGTGTITLADAPMAQCHFDELYYGMRYDKIVDYYKEKGIDINVVDMRGIAFDDSLNKLTANKIIRKEKDAINDVIVNVGKHSAFNDLPEEIINQLKAPKLDPVKMKNHHTLTKHEYSIHKLVLNADVIINMPKPKSHRKAGMTACCKNFIGVNVRKDLLPHLTYGSVSEKGDAYLEKNFFLKLSNYFNDKYDYYTFQGSEKRATFFRILKGGLRRIGQTIKKEMFWEGSWYGNDTIWRTISDIDKIVYYADKDGLLQENIQRKIFNICDMIIVGEKEGPLEPIPKKLNTIVMSEAHVAVVDKFICKYFGFDDKYVKNIDFQINKEKIQANDTIIVSEQGIEYSIEAYPFKEETQIEAGYGWHGFIDKK